MSKFVRDRKKHWRIVIAIGKQQGITLYQPKKFKIRSTYILRQQSVPFTLRSAYNFCSQTVAALKSSIGKPNSIFFHQNNNEDQLRGISINQVWFDEEDDRLFFNGFDEFVVPRIAEMIQKEENDKNKPKE